MFKVAIVGLGHVATHQIAALERSEDFELIAGCDSNAARFSALPRSARTFTELSELLKVPELDVVVIASPNRLHVPHGIEVMAADKWLLIEKPLTETSDELARFEQHREKYAARCTLALHAAFGVEVDWCHAEFAGELFDGFELNYFTAGFYDPYFDDGSLKPNAASLGGSWTDSGINALSVICRFINAENLVVRDSRMTRVGGVGCREVQGTVELEFAGHERRGSGSIDTNWTLGRNHKSTRLSDVRTDRHFILDHSAQQVVLRADDRERVVFSCDNGLPRLTNHYMGVFRDLALQMKRNEDNFRYCLELHRILHQAGAWGS
jgi:D-galactose 1-dehydrogenase